MAELLKLVKANDSGDVDSIDLLAWLAQNGWVQGISARGEDVDEVVTLHLPGNNHDDLAENFQLLDGKLEQIYRSLTTGIADQVWLRAQLAGETSARQAFVVSAKRGKLAAMGPFMPGNHAVNYPLGLRRKGYWETLGPGSSDTGAISDTDISHVGGMLDYSNVPGDVNARVDSLAITPTYNAPGVGDGIDEVWIGMRSDLYPLTNFNPVWNLRKASTFDADSSGGTSNADVTAQDGYKVVCTFGTVSSMTKRLLISTTDAHGANGADQIGVYEGVLRAQTTGTLVADVRAGVGYKTSSAFYFGDRVAVSGPGWNMYSLGQIRIPPSDVSGLLYNSAIEIDAELISGSGNLELDCLLTVPSAESFMHAAFGQRLESNVNDYRFWNTRVRPDESIASHLYNVQQAAVYEPVHPDVITFGVPPATAGKIVVVANRDHTSLLMNSVSLSLSYIPRWATLRGAA